MKLKISLDKNKIREFFVSHFEKILFGMIVVCFLLFVVNAVGRDVYPKTPQELEQAVEQAEKHLENTKPEADREPVDYISPAKRSRIRIAEKFYEHETPWTPLIFPQRSKRDLPMLFTVRKLRGVAGAGPFSIANAASMKNRPKPKKKKTPKKDDKKSRKDEREERLELSQMRGPNTKGARWVVLTGLVPVTEQEKAYYETFKDAQYRNPETDMPDYIYYRVERAEVDPQGEAAEPNWVRFNLRAELAKNEERTNGQGQQDTCDSHCLHPALCWPLPPLSGRKWGEEVVSEPEILLRPKRMQRAPEESEEPEDDQAVPGDDPDDPAANGPGTTGRRRPGRMGGGMAPGGSMGRRGMMPGGEGMMGMEGGMMGMRSGGAKAEMNPYLLFRFFDFNVKPGKRYRYRVRLMLRNPNYEVDPRYLKDKKLATKQWVETDWSDPTDVVSVPYDDRLLAISAKASALAAVEPTVKVMVVHRDEETGQEIFDDVPNVVRGKLINYADRKGTEAGTNREVEAAFLTQSVLLDIRGGQKLPVRDSSMTQPGRLLVLDIEGNLRVHDELDDLSDALDYEEPERSRPTGGLDGMEGMMPGDMPMDMMMPGGEGLDALGGAGGRPKKKRSRRPRRGEND